MVFFPFISIFVADCADNRSNNRDDEKFNHPDVQAIEAA